MSFRQIIFILQIDGLLPYCEKTFSQFFSYQFAYHKKGYVRWCEKEVCIPVEEILHQFVHQIFLDAIPMKG